MWCACLCGIFAIAKAKVVNCFYLTEPWTVSHVWENIRDFPATAVECGIYINAVSI